MFLTFRPALSRGVRVGGLPSPEHLTQPPDRHQRHQEWSVARPVSALQSPDVHVSVSCSGWRLRLWTVDKQSGRGENVDSMCGEDNRREYTVPSVYSRWHQTEHCDCFVQSNICSGSSTSQSRVSTKRLCPTKSLGSHLGLWSQTACSSRWVSSECLKFVCLFYSMFGICLSVTLLPQMPKVVPKF